MEPNIEKTLLKHQLKTKELDKKFKNKKNYSNTFREISKPIKKTLIAIGAISVLSNITDTDYNLFDYSDYNFSNYIETANYNIKGQEKTLINNEENKINFNHKSFKNTIINSIENNKSHIPNPFNNGEEVRLNVFQDSDEFPISTSANYSLFLNTKEGKNIRQAAIMISGKASYGEYINYSDKTEEYIYNMMGSYGIDKDTTQTYIMLHELMHLSVLLLNNANPDNPQDIIKNEIMADVASFLYMVKSQEMDLFESIELYQAIIFFRDKGHTEHNDYEHNTQMGLRVAMNHLENDEKFIEKLDYNDIDLYSYVLSEYIVSQTYGSENDLYYKDYIKNAINNILEEKPVIPIRYNVSKNFQHGFQDKIFEIIDNVNNKGHNTLIKKPKNNTWKLIIVISF